MVNEKRIDVTDGRIFWWEMGGVTMRERQFSLAFLFAETFWIAGGLGITILMPKNAFANELATAAYWPLFFTFWGAALGGVLSGSVKGMGRFGLAGFLLGLLVSVNLMALHFRPSAN
jgi:hypothetical protein